MVWGDADVNVTNVTATGSGNTGGLDSLKGVVQQLQQNSAHLLMVKEL
jgi:hypothetical protein